MPYLNAKPLVEWFHEADSNAHAHLVYDVPSQLAAMLRDGSLDAANVSVFELFTNPRLRLVPGISISATGPVKSVRLFCRVPVGQVQTVALDTSSLTSAALVRILLAERYRIRPCFEPSAPDLPTMLAHYDAALIIGDLKLFEDVGACKVLDLGAEWNAHTGLPFVFAAWLARDDRDVSSITADLAAAKQWGVARLQEIADRWAGRMGVSVGRARDYLCSVMDYDLEARHLDGLRSFQERCLSHGLIDTLQPVRFTGA